MSARTYPQALNIWRCVNVCALLASLILLAKMVGSTDWRNWALPPLLVLVSMPLIQSLSHGQNTGTSLFLLTATVTAWRANRGVLAGMIGGLLFYKPQLGPVVAAVMLLDLGLPALAGLAATGTTLLSINVLALPGTLSDYLHRLPAIVHWMQIEHAYLWERHVTLKAFWRLLFHGREAGESLPLTAGLTYLSLTIAGGALLFAIYRARAKGGACRDRLIAATIVTMPLLMPFYFDYDLLLLAIPLTLFGVDRLRRPQPESRLNLWQTRFCIALFFWLFVNPAVGFHTHLNVTVLLLSAVAAMQLAKTARTESALSHHSQSQSPPLPLAA
jgi:alpha-1,2-mannosyltransferase